MSKDFKEIVVASGKGGVGKSMLASSFSILFSEKEKVLALDCDVDAPNLAIWLGEAGGWQKEEDVSVSKRPVIKENTKDLDLEECAGKCRFDALDFNKEKGLSFNDFLCEGCGACRFFCPAGISGMKSVKSGTLRSKETKFGFPLISGLLLPGRTGSGKIVAEIKKRAEAYKKNVEIIDAAPGTGCLVIAALRDSDFAVLVTEPTPAAFSDLKKVQEVVKHFSLRWGLVLNKWDIGEDKAKEIRSWAGDNFLGRISYDKKVSEAVSQMKPIVKTQLGVKKEIERIFNRLQGRL